LTALQNRFREASLNTDNATSYRPSLVVIALKQIAAVAERILPRALYDRVYDSGFAAYRALLRALYFRHVIYSRLTGNSEGLKKAATVFKMMPYSLVGTSGLEATYDVVYAAEQDQLPGSIVECGVAQGGSAALMALVAARFGNRRAIWLLDSFEGLPAPTGDDFVDGKTGPHVRELPPGSCLGLQEQVEALLFDKLKLDRQRITLVKGWFEHTIAPHVDQVGTIAVLRIDADWYESVKSCLDNLYDSVVPGGYVIIDDYDTCFGARKAVDEFLGDRDLQVELIHDGRGGCHFVKPA
jgi:O-methyltransferase